MRWTRKFSRFSAIFASEFRAWLLVGLVLISLLTMLVLLFSPFFDVREIRIRRQDPRVDIEEVQHLLTPLFRERLILVTKNEILSMLSPNYPDIDRIDISKEYPSMLTVSIYLEPVVASVIIDDSDVPSSASGTVVTASGSYAYLTEQGYFVTSPIKLSGTVPVPVLRLTDWGIRPQNRTRAVSRDFIEQIFIARDTLRTDFGLSTRDINVYVRAQEFHIRTNKTTLWFDLKSPLSLQLERFREFLKSLTLDQAKEYIDLRIADKIIYK